MGDIKMKNKERELKERMMKSAKDLSEHIKTLNITIEQRETLDNLILKHVDDCIHWGIKVKLAYMLGEAENEKKTMYEI
ncbi:hypothetical protein A2U11_10060 [Fusobacterium necrophorum subsp. funduliforme]|nr:hypothetical protein A2U11_10060 [Fusobacterium necrophorum subsp. funduliforme]